MRPDEYKQAQGRKYQAKLRSRGSSESAKVIQEKRKERNSKSRSFQHKSGDEHDEDTEEIAYEEGDKPKRRDFRRRKLESNSYRYKDISDTEETTDGTYLGTRNLLQIIDDSETRSFDPSTYFQFKEEKDWDASVEASEANELDEIYQNLMNIRFDDLELSLSSLSLAERLDLNDDIFTKGQEIDLDSSLYATGPIVPKTVKSELMLKNVEPTKTTQSSTSSNIIKETQIKQEKKVDLGKKIAPDVSQASVLINKTSFSKTKSGKPVSSSLISNNDDDDIDEFLKSLDDDDAKQNKPTANDKSSSRKKISTNLKSKITIVKSDGDDAKDWLDEFLK